MIILLLLFAGIVIFEVPGLIYRKYWKETLVFSFFLALAFCLSLLSLLGMPLPSPAKGIETAVTSFVNWIKK